ncbi:MAG TPA: hypothetical protein VKA26_12390 [Ignavibacteriaceae bacterium]|nr:hypothetical protein [Ignavibacteriaceae bacterium]
MKILKIILKLLGFILLAVLACFGMAIGGAVPFTPICKPDERVEFKTELVLEKKEEESEFKEKQ